jgi:O-acetyl-ADP-ribose deacetylase (regulator of RNase III)
MNQLTLVEEEGDILLKEKGIICHQVNCMGVMGTGIALQIRNRYPAAYDQYCEWCKYHRHNLRVLLGFAQTVNVGDDLFIANVFGQFAYGRERPHTDYNAVQTAFKGLARVREEVLPHLKLYIPYKMGCGNAGGDWERYKAIIATYIPDAIICKRRE